jgi:hypothetical protein
MTKENQNPTAGAPVDVGLRLTKPQQQLLQRFQSDLQALEREVAAVQRVLDVKREDQHLWISTVVQDAGAPIGSYRIEVDSATGEISLMPDQQRQ